MDPETPTQTNQIPQPATPSAPNPSPLKQIRTFEGDVAEAIKKQNESLVSIQRAEEKKREAIGTLAPEAMGSGQGFEWKPLVMSLLTIILVSGGGYGAYFAWTTYNEKTVLPYIETPANQFINTLTIKNIDASVLGRQAILGLIGEARRESREEASIEQIEMRRDAGDASELLSTEDFLTRLNVKAPNPLVRAFGDLFMLGILGGNLGHVFIIIELDSFENAFPGMLDWEAKMVEDILPLFATQEVVSSTHTLAEFEDKTIQNHDTRILRSSSGEIVLIYGFFDNAKLIITDNESSFRTIINRLQSEKLSR